MGKVRQQPYSIANPTAAADGEKPFGNKSETNRKEIDKKNRLLLARIKNYHYFCTRLRKK